MKRGLKISLDGGNRGKKDALDQLWEAYREAMSDFLDRLFAGEDLSEDFLKSYESPLSYRYKQCAKRQAMKLFKSWCRGKKKKNKPTLRNPSMTLDSRFIEVQESGNSFDFWIKIATLDKGHPVLIPVKSYHYLNTYLEHWDLVAGGRLIKQRGRWVLVVTFEKVPPAARTEGKTVASDIGYRKMVTTSERQVVGPRLKELIEKAARKVSFSQGYYQAKAEIKNYVNRELKKLITEEVKIIVLENLKNLKDGKHGIWSKAVNRKFAFWVYRYILIRIAQLCEVAGVQCHAVDPAYTSQRCPKCEHIETLNRQRERFRCRRCGYADDADYVGALNILWRFTGEPIVPQVHKSTIC
jgi:IS605 OrfB family transposase